MEGESIVYSVRRAHQRLRDDLSTKYTAGARGSPEGLRAEEIRLELLYLEGGVNMRVLRLVLVAAGYVCHNKKLQENSEGMILWVLGGCA